MSSVDRLSVTVPSELGAALRALADARGATVSTLVTEAIAHQVRLAALDRALAEAERRHGALDPELVDRAEAELIAALKSTPGRSRRRRKR
jgi:predicted transcriptional regulator